MEIALSNGDNVGNKDPEYLRELRALGKATPQLSDFENLERELYVSGSDRATAVLFGTYVENHLGDLITSKLRPDLKSSETSALMKFDGPLGTFSARILMAYSLELVGPIMRFDLELIRNIRNVFAHSRMPIDFKTKAVFAACAHLKTVDLKQNLIPYGYLNRVSGGELALTSDTADPKTRYISTCHNLSYRMLLAKRGYPQDDDSVFSEGTPVP